MLKVSFTGDLMCLQEQNEAILSTGNLQNGYNEIFKNVKHLFAQSDLLIGNLETPVSKAPLSSESICFNTPVEFIRACIECGFNFVSTANNHCLDRGTQGLVETIENLDMEGLPHSGTYTNEEDSEGIHYIEKKGFIIAVICATFGTNSEFNGILLPSDKTWMVDLLKRQNKPSRARFNPNSESGRKMIADNVTSAAITNKANFPYVDKFLRKIESARNKADLVFVLPHIGGQYNPFPGTYTRHIVDLASVRKPSLIVCNHPHVPHCLAIVNDIPTAFSLGNFCFTPGVGYFISNSLAEYGVILHTYWNTKTKMLEKSSFSIVKNVVGDDGIARVFSVGRLLEILESSIERERLSVEVQAVANRVASTLVPEPFNIEIDITHTIPRL